MPKVEKSEVQMNSHKHGPFKKLLWMDGPWGSDKNGTRLLGSNHHGRIELYDWHYLKATQQAWATVIGPHGEENEREEEREEKERERKAQFLFLVEKI